MKYTLFTFVFLFVSQVLAGPLTEACLEVVTGEHEDGASLNQAIQSEVVDPLSEAGFVALSGFMSQDFIVTGLQFDGTACQRINVAEALGEQAALEDDWIKNLGALSSNDDAVPATIDLEELDAEPAYDIYTCTSSVRYSDNDVKTYTMQISYPVSSEMKDDMDRQMAEDFVIEATYGTDVNISVTTVRGGVETSNSAEFSAVHISRSEDGTSISTVDPNAITGVSFSSEGDFVNADWLWINLNANTPAAEFNRADCTYTPAG